MERVAAWRVCRPGLLSVVSYRLWQLFMRVECGVVCEDMASIDVELCSRGEKSDVAQASAIRHSVRVRSDD